MVVVVLEGGGHCDVVGPAVHGLLLSEGDVAADSAFGEISLLHRSKDVVGAFGVRVVLLLQGTTHRIHVAKPITDRLFIHIQVDIVAPPGSEFAAAFVDEGAVGFFSSE